MSALFNRIKKLFTIKKLTEVGIDNAVTREWIDETQKNEILGAEEVVETPTEETTAPEVPVEEIPVE